VIRLKQNRHQWRTLRKTILNVWVPEKGGEFLDYLGDCYVWVPKKVGEFLDYLGDCYVWVPKKGGEFLDYLGDCYIWVPKKRWRVS
jgi:hypothetical protein